LLDEITDIEYEKAIKDSSTKKSLEEARADSLKSFDF